MKRKDASNRLSQLDTLEQLASLRKRFVPSDIALISRFPTPIDSIIVALTMEEFVTVHTIGVGHFTVSSAQFLTRTRANRRTSTAYEFKPVHRRGRWNDGHQAECDQYVSEMHLIRKKAMLCAYATRRNIWWETCLRDCVEFRVRSF